MRLGTRWIFEGIIRGAEVGDQSSPTKYEGRDPERGGRGIVEKLSVSEGLKGDHRNSADP